MATTADFKNGLYLNFEGKPCSIVWFQHVKPGKGPSFVKSKLRDLENGRILEKTWNAGEKIDVITVEHREYQYLYAEDDGFNFMNNETFDQIKLEKDIVENNDLMKEGQIVQMVFHVDGEEERCLTCELPTYVELEIKSLQQPYHQGSDEDNGEGALQEVFGLVPQQMRHVFE